MKVTLSGALIALLVWDYCASAAGESASERFYRAAVSSEIVGPLIVSARVHLGDVKPALINGVRHIGGALESMAENESSAGTAQSSEVAAIDQSAEKKRTADHNPISEEPSLDPASSVLSEDAELPHRGTAFGSIPILPAFNSAGSSSSQLNLSGLLAEPGAPPFPGSCPAEAEWNPTLINSAITAAGKTTASSLDFLVHMAILESRLEMFAKAGTSTATGLFQFTEQTWFSLLKRHGAVYGFESYADAIKNEYGIWVVSDKNLRQEMLAMRKDPTLSAVMAAELAQDNANAISAAIGRTPSDGELYLAHFLGEQGAIKLIEANTETPTRAAAQLFPTAAAANPWVFRDSNGGARSVAELYTFLTRDPSPAEIKLFCQKGYQRPQIVAEQ